VTPPGIEGCFRRSGVWHGFLQLPHNNIVRNLYIVLLKGEEFDGVFHNHTFRYLTCCKLTAIGSVSHRGVYILQSKASATAAYF
jgi:hypothetical protein